MGDVDRRLGIGEGREQWVEARAGRQVQLAVREVAQARREAVAEEGHEAEDVVGRAAGVDGVLLDGEAGLVVEQTVEHVRRLAGGGGDDLRVERPVLVGDVGVEAHARLVAVTRVDVCDRLARPTGEEVLSIRRGRGPVSPDARQRQGAVRVDQAAQRFGVGGLGDVPVMHEREAAQARAAARVGHAGEAEVDAVRQQAGQQRRAVVAGPARAAMGEALGEAGPGVDVHEHVGDAGAWQAVVERTPERLDRGRRHGARRGDGQARRLKADVRQFAGPCASRDDGGQLLEPRASLGQMLREDRRHRQRQRP